MKKLWVLALAALAVVVPAHAQVFKLSPEELAKYTANNPFGRLADGRPNVPDSILARVKDMSMEEVTGLERAGFPSQYIDNLKILHPNLKLVGRALTLELAPYRSDVADVDHSGVGLFRLGGGPPGRPSTPPPPPDPAHNITHQTAIDMLRPGDVLVIDAHGIHGGIIGDNLATYIKDVGAGFVFDGDIRDMDGIKDIDVAGYYRSAVPPALTNCMVAGINVPVVVEGVTVVPGDVVLGDAEGVYIIPPSQVKRLVDEADDVHIHDEWTKMKFGQGVGAHGYKSTDIYGRPHDPALIKEYQQYLKEHLEELHKQRGDQ